MKQYQATLNCYDRTAEPYGRQYFGELVHKPLDRLLLERFAAENRSGGPVADLGCGTGQTTRFLYDQGVRDLIGIDLSPAMVDTATRLNGGLIRFETGNMLALEYPDGHFGSAIAFYAIVHFQPDELPAVFAEIRRVLRTGGQFLFSFHTGEEVVHMDYFLEQEVDIDFYFFQPEAVLQMLAEGGWRVLDALVRFPYMGQEHPNRRAYILAEAL